MVVYLFAAFRTVSVYLKEWPDTHILEQLGFRENTSGANVWLIIPKDHDIFYGVKPVADIPCVHRIQVCLDLKYLLERAEEAAAELRKSMTLAILYLVPIGLSSIIPIYT
jgi:hypothetical protein